MSKKFSALLKKVLKLKEQELKYRRIAKVKDTELSLAKMSIFTFSNTRKKFTSKSGQSLSKKLFLKVVAGNKNVAKEALTDKKVLNTLKNQRRQAAKKALVFKQAAENQRPRFIRKGGRVIPIRPRKKR